MLFSKFVSRVVHKHIYFPIIKRSCCSASTCGGAPPVPEATTEARDEGGNPGLVLGVFEESGSFELTSAAAEVDQKSGGKVSQKLNELSCSMKLGTAFVITDVAPEYGAVALASYGPKDAGWNELEQLDEKRENIRHGVGAGVKALSARRCARVAVDAGGEPAAAAEAAALAAWRFQEFRSCTDRDPVSSVSMYGPPDPSWATGSIRGEAQNWARYLSDMPANKMTPVDMAQAALDTLCPLGVKVSCRDRTWIEAQKMEALLAVARGSCEEPMFLECEYRGTNGPPVLLAAKGVTFDSGGLCLKRPEDMVENRGSMAGAAVALAAIKALALMKVPVNVVAVIPLCENMISGQCMKVGDMVRALNNLSIQIEDTDMEGRLVLADALLYGQAAHRPALVLDVATLTHGILLATGGGAFGAFTNHAGLWGALRAAGGGAGDRPWRLPLWGYYQRQITNEPAVDLRNKGSGLATACLGAAFLKNFVCGDWLHLDITGVGKLAHSQPPYLDQRRMTGRPARTLIYLFEEISKGCLKKESDPSPCANKD
ncbi:unnamed protein product [Plutella xylostella]|uniref:Cytosol aminopeptidase n=1 Tax=Plutella xylostella TaxID=51655 RepID=A0A8S4G5Z6_PLUXY|nr:unnamed protein product [Plutella xylostella]